MDLIDTNVAYGGNLVTFKSVYSNDQYFDGAGFPLLTSLPFSPSTHIFLLAFIKYASMWRGSKMEEE